MVASTGDYRPLLSGGLWLAGSAAVAATLYGIEVARRLPALWVFDIFWSPVATWAARDLHRKEIWRYRQEILLQLGIDTLMMLGNRYLIEPGRMSAVQWHATILGGAALIVGLFAILQLLQLTANENRMAHDDTVLGIACLAGAFIWLVLARSFQAIREIELPEALPLMGAFREAQWIALIAAAGPDRSVSGTDAGVLVRPGCYWSGSSRHFAWRVCCDGLATILDSNRSRRRTSVSPIHLLLREAIFTAANPVTSLVRTFENRCGVSLRSSWAIAFVKNLTLPLLVFLMLLCWGLTSLAIVETHQMAVREQFGKVVGKPLLPGLHMMLPWPFGRIRAFPVKTVQQLPIGYVESDEPPNRDQPRALLWTKPHAKEEFSLVAG